MMMKKNKTNMLAIGWLMPTTVLAWMHQTKPTDKNYFNSRLFVKNIPTQQQQDVALSPTSVASSSIPQPPCTTLPDQQPSFLTEAFAFSECDNSNTPPSLALILRSIQYLFEKNKSDLRGRYVPHATHGSLLGVAHAVKKGAKVDDQPLLTPFIAYCIGYAMGRHNTILHNNDAPKNILAIGRDPRRHGAALADALARGATAAGMHIYDLGVATTPACAAYAKKNPGMMAVMVTASHLPADRNGFKIFGMEDFHELLEPTKQCATEWFNHGIIPLYNGHAVTSHESDFSLDFYRNALKSAGGAGSLKGFKIVLNAGNGSGGFFADVLKELGADVSGSIHLDPNPDFPNGIPNPEDSKMLQQTIEAMEVADADLGIMLDTDADRCGFVVPTESGYTALNRNRLIALLGVVFSHEYPGCTIVTDSVTSEGLTTFLQDTLGLKHERYLKGYANVIGRAKELTESGVCNAELAIETSGHCAMREHEYIDDGTYTAIKVSSLLSRHGRNMMNLISKLPEMEEVAELRMEVASLDALDHIFDLCLTVLEGYCESADETTNWQIDPLNLEGIRIRLGDGQFFMLRKSLHDPIISLQIEAHSRDTARDQMVLPLHRLLRQVTQINDAISLDVLRNY